MKKLSAELKKRLTEKAGSVAGAAEKLGISANSIRVWLKRETYPEVELLQLAQFSDLADDLESLRTRYEFKIAATNRQPLNRVREQNTRVLSLEDALALMDRRIDQLGRLYQQFGDDVSRLFGSMKTNDVFAYMSVTEFPYEMEHDGWVEAGAAIAAAVSLGAHFVYLYPSDHFIQQLRALGLRQARQVVTEAEFLPSFLKFRNDIRSMLGQSSNVDVDGLVQAFPCDASPFFVPDHKYVIFKPQEGSARGLARFPTGSSTRELALHLPLGRLTTGRLVDFVREVLSKRPDGQSIVQLLHPTHVDR